MKQQLLETAYKLVVSIKALDDLGKNELLLPALLTKYTEEELTEITDFIESSVMKDIDDYAFVKAFADYIEAVEQAKKYMEMAKGYQEMANINLTISQEDHHLEEEGASIYEMDSQKAKGSSQTG